MSLQLLAMVCGVSGRNSGEDLKLMICQKDVETVNILSYAVL